MAVETLRPNAAGDTTDIQAQYPVSTFHYDKVDEAVSDGDTTYVYIYSDDAWSKYDLYNLPSHSIGSGTINSIKIYCVCKEWGVAYCRIKLKTGGAEYDNGSDLALTSSWVSYSNQWNTNPKTSSAWTWTDIDALQIGVYLKGEAATAGYCTQVYVEVDYTEALPQFGNSMVSKLIAAGIL